MDVMLSDRATFQVLRKDPSPSLQKKMNGILLKLKKEGELSTQVYNQLRCSSGSIPHIYGLLKIHKQDTPLRPIVSFYSSPTCTYHLSKFLVGVLSCLLGRISSAICNSLCHLYISFAWSRKFWCRLMYIVSLFTKVPWHYSSLVNVGGP